MSLLIFLKEHKSEARKIFGERELKIIEKQLLGINLTQSERNRLSRDIRKKLEFVKKLLEYSQEFELKKGIEIKKKIEEIKQEILNDKLRSRIKEIWLFGSSVDNSRTFRSDIDIAVLFDEINKKEAVEFRLRVMSYFDKKVDVQVFNVLPEKIKESIIKNHKVIFENESN